MSGIRQRHCLLLAVRFRTLMVDAADLMEQADFVLDDINRKLVRRIPAKEREKPKEERLERNAEKREKKKAQKAERAAQKENRARKKDKTTAVSPTATGAPIRKFTSYGMSTAVEINEKLKPAVSEVSRLTEEARAIMATIQHTKPHIRRMPVSKLATAQAFNQTLGYAVRDILRLTEEARTIMNTIQQRKQQHKRQRTQQTQWRHLRRWGRDTTIVSLKPDTSPKVLLDMAYKARRTSISMMRAFKKRVRSIKALIRQRKRDLRKWINAKPGIVQTQRRRRIRRVSPSVHVVRYPSGRRTVRNQTVPALQVGKRFARFRTVMQRQPGFRTVTQQRQSVMEERKQKRDELAATVASWLGGGGSAGHDKSGLGSLFATAENDEERDGRGGRRRRR
ncbi:uncharacterized protein J4E84_004950 [Alternaria hordeiaustralica]|uniref:uncharacterized protein n=1 Tax=Alternaria hordeiaustralica TaxID=1187925 RepID=UPI0020C4C905|nr:uncharacterized protein J4E84_004950 [Alternaria hordeiaustralica]KAI4688022.1 hypothetical protein J4E84_004950 [Alternaria hordeiaustralica]